MTLLLNNSDVEKALRRDDAMCWTENMYRDLAEGKALTRARSQIYLPQESKEHPGYTYRFKSQEGGGARCGVWALRVTSDMSGFSYEHGIKRRRLKPVASGNKYCGLVILFDIEKIEPIAIMPDGFVQKMRVAALSTVAAKYLVPAKPRVLGLLGSGGQAGAHLEFLCHSFPFEKVKVYSPNPEHCRDFCREMGKQLGRAIDPVATPKDAVVGSDCVQAATNVFEPIVDGHWLEKGMYVCCIVGETQRRELDDECVRRADVYIVHSKEVGMAEKSPALYDVVKKGIKKEEEMHNVEDLVAGKVPGRTREDQITMFNNNTGAGIQFAAVGAAVLQRAREMGLGKEIPTDWFLEDLLP